jgi:hypothetical protein
MSITKLQFRDLAFDAAGAIAKSTAGLSDQSRTEVFQCLDMIQIWQPWLAETFGQIVGIRHRSAPDDPPDLDLIFTDGRIVGMEHTRLQPAHLGQAEALMRKSREGGFIPSISSPPKNFQEMKDIIVGVKAPWSPVVNDAAAIFDRLAITIRTKMRGIPNGGIIGVVHDLIVSNTRKRMITELAENIVNRAEFADFAKYTLILLDRTNHHEFHSSLVRRGEPIREKIGELPPLTPDQEQLLAEMRAEISKLDIADDE